MQVLKNIFNTFAGKNGVLAAVAAYGAAVSGVGIIFAAAALALPATVSLALSGASFVLNSVMLADHHRLRRETARP